MNYDEGTQYMISLSEKLRGSLVKRKFRIGKLIIEYPGRKVPGDYRLTKDGVVPTHADVVNLIYKSVNTNNYTYVVSSLEDIFLNGLRAKAPAFKQETKELLYWITLQEEINYPSPQYLGRKLPFQRFFEAILAKLNFCSLEEVLQRTNNHGNKVPKLFRGIIIKTPSFYQSQMLNYRQA